MLQKREGDESRPRLQPRAHHVKDACRLLGISASSLYRHACGGKIKLIHIGGRTLVPESEIARLSTEGTD